MIFNFFKKKKGVDPVIEAQIEQTHVRFDKDIEVIEGRLRREYPTAVSVIEDYRAGYVTEAELEIRFSKEEIETIHVETVRRNEEEKDVSSTGYL